MVCRTLARAYSRCARTNEGKPYVSQLLAVHQILAAGCPNPAKLGEYLPVNITNSAGAACPGLPQTDSGATAWILTSSALVLLMTPALAFFYGGMVRAKHALTMLLQNFAAIGVVSVTWIVIGFTWAFGGEGKYLGDLHFVFLRHMSDASPTLGAIAS